MCLINQVNCISDVWVCKQWISFGEMTPSYNIYFSEMKTKKIAIQQLPSTCGLEDVCGLYRQ